LENCASTLKPCVFFLIGKKKFIDTNQNEIYFSICKNFKNQKSFCSVFINFHPKPKSKTKKIAFHKTV